MQDIYGLALNGEENPINMRDVAVEQLAHFKREGRALRSYDAALRKLSKRCDCILQSQEPLRAGVSGILGRSQSRIASASCSAATVVSTRKVMLAAQLGEKVGGRSGTADSHIFVAMADALDGSGDVLALPFQIGCQNVV